MSALQFWRKSTLKNAILISILFSVIYTAFLVHIPYFNILKLKTNDFFCRLAYKKKIPGSQIDNIVLISIDDESNKIIGKRWPWSRDVYACLIDRINQYHPKVIGMDIAFLGKSQKIETDLFFADSLKKAGNVLLAAYFNFPDYIVPCEMFSESALGYGIINNSRDKDLCARRAQLISLYNTGELIDYSLGLKLVCSYFGIPIKNIKRIGLTKIESFCPDKKIQIPICKDGTIFVNYIAGRERFLVIPVWKVLKETFSPEIFKDKIVIIGAFSEAFHDISLTPLGLKPGVIILANQVLMLMEENFIKEIPFVLNSFIILILAIVTAIFVFRLNIFMGAIFLFFEIFVLEFIGFKMFMYNLWGDFFAPLLILPGLYLTINLYKYSALLLEQGYLKKQAITDELTGLYTYRYFQGAIKNEFEKTSRYKTSFSFVIFDVDHFKSINDTYGHKTGNVVLRKISDIMRNSFRKTDVLARFGGDEFCVIIPLVDEVNLLKMVNKLRKSVEETKFPGVKKKITISIGVTLLPEPKILSAEKLFECSDIALYQAKKMGRNRICVFNSELFEKGEMSDDKF
ncbi:diguanylate cyclase [bacterium]|nr:diguanylate cyclase [bacterium]